MQTNEHTPASTARAARFTRHARPITPVLTLGLTLGLTFGLASSGCQVAKQTLRADGGFDLKVESKTIALENIRATAKPSIDAIVTVEYAGWYYSIANDDIRSKDTLALFMQLCRIQSGVPAPGQCSRFRRGEADITRTLQEYAPCQTSAARNTRGFGQRLSHQTPLMLTAALEPTFGVD